MTTLTLSRPSLATATAFALSFAAGAIVAAAFLDLRPEYVATPAGATVAVLAFAGTLFAGFRLTAATSPPRAPALLGISVAALAGVAAAGTGVGARLLVIALAAAALAIQTAGARRITELAGVTTAHGHLWTRIGSIPTLVAGAVTGIAVITAAPAVALLISAVAAIGAVALVRRVDLHRD